MVDRSTADKVLLDKGRVLVLVPQSKSCIVNIKVYGGKEMFMVKVAEDTKVVEVEWVEKLLALRKMHVKVDRNPQPVKDVFQIS